LSIFQKENIRNKEQYSKFFAILCALLFLSHRQSLLWLLGKKKRPPFFPASRFFASGRHSSLSKKVFKRGKKGGVHPERVRRAQWITTRKR
jgi:hypothetical protein